MTKKESKSALDRNLNIRIDSNLHENIQSVSRKLKLKSSEFSREILLRHVPEYDPSNSYGGLTC